MIYMTRHDEKIAIHFPKKYFDFILCNLYLRTYVNELLHDLKLLEERWIELWDKTSITNFVTIFVYLYRDMYLIKRYIF